MSNYEFPRQKRRRWQFELVVFGFTGLMAMFALSSIHILTVGMWVLVFVPLVFFTAMGTAKYGVDVAKDASLLVGAGLTWPIVTGVEVGVEPVAVFLTALTGVLTFLAAMVLASRHENWLLVGLWLLASIIGGAIILW